MRSFKPTCPSCGTRAATLATVCAGCGSRLLPLGILPLRRPRGPYRVTAKPAPATRFIVSSVTGYPADRYERTTGGRYTTVYTVLDKAFSHRIIREFGRKRKAAERHAAKLNREHAP